MGLDRKTSLRLSIAGACAATLLSLVCVIVSATSE